MTFMSRTLYLFLSCCFLMGCDKFPYPLMSSTHSTMAYHDVVLVIGQSNSLRFEQYGETAFVQDYQRFFPGSTVQFINCSVGGTAISQWQVDGPEIAACKVPIAPTVILFYQGETDAYLKTPNWAQQFTSAVLGWRRVFGNIPVIYAQIAVEDSTIYCPQADWDSLQYQQTMVSIPQVVMIETMDISQLDPDLAVAGGVHISPQSCVNIAERYVEALAKLRVIKHD